MGNNKSLFIRKLHRYLGIIIGIQLLGWTFSGLFFSWNDLDNVHGDPMRKNPAFISAKTPLASPELSIRELQRHTRIDSIHSVQLISVNGNPLYQIGYFSGDAGNVHLRVHYRLADAVTGQPRAALSEREAVAVAKDHVVATAKVTNVSMLNNVDEHHEYRERPLPAYAVTFEDPQCTVYISAERGTFQSIRHRQWRTFDFLWMIHTMDYRGRDDINNWLLRILSVFGLVTVLSGFTLFFVSSKRIRNLRS